MNFTFFEWLAIIDTSCWIICFWWMHQISSRQNAMLRELQEQALRVEKVSREEHDLIKEIHPKVKNIEGSMTQVADAVKTGANS